jgi:hypothetical protein
MATTIAQSVRLLSALSDADRRDAVLDIKTEISQGLYPRASDITPDPPLRIHLRLEMEEGVKTFPQQTARKLTTVPR